MRAAAQEEKPAGGRAVPERTASVFEEMRPAEYAPDIFGERQKTDGVLRVLTVDERYGMERTNELVRVPLFLHAAEAVTDPDSFVIVPVEGGEPIAYQADDIRKAADGKIARMHLWFPVNKLKAWGRQQFHLSYGKNPVAALKPMPVRASKTHVTLESDGLKVTFNAEGEYQGQIQSLHTPLGKVHLGEKGLTPRLYIFRLIKGQRASGGAINFDKPDAVEIVFMRWAEGPYFSKLAVGMRAIGGKEIAEYVYTLPKQGDRLTVTEKIYKTPESRQQDRVGTGMYAFNSGNVLLEGELWLGDSDTDQKRVSIPAGVRKPVEAVHGHFKHALVNEKAGFSLLFLPYVETGGVIKKPGERKEKGDRPAVKFEEISDRVIRFEASSGMGVGDSRTMQACWGQYSLIFSKAVTPDSLWELGVRNYGSLTAVVDEPWATTEDFDALTSRLAQNFWNIKYWGKNWVQEATLTGLGGNAQATVTRLHNEKRQIPLKPLDGGPYEFTYIHSSIVPLLKYYAEGSSMPPARIEAIRDVACFAAQNARKRNGKVSRFGQPFMQSFGLALNMHVGTYLMCMWLGPQRDDPDMAQWARDALHDPLVLGVFGRGQRPYGVNYADSASTDFLYQCISDLWIRAAELICNEDLSIHPSVYGRYFDSIDVTADFYQGKVNDEGVRTNTWDRALMWRTQYHSHRWEAWDAGPYLGLLAKASDKGKVGITEACYWVNYELPNNIGWSRLNPVFFAKMLVRNSLSSYRPAPLPAGPANVRIARDPTGGNKITWDASPGENIAGYRIYRSEPFGRITEWKWLNSPYAAAAPSPAPTSAPAPSATKPAATEPKDEPAAMDDAKEGEGAPSPVSPAPAPAQAPAAAAGKNVIVPPVLYKLPPLPVTLIQGTSFHDTEGLPESRYLIIAQDKNGRCSDLFPSEPPPAPSVNP
ncbi:hypothetical protein DB346_00760 [Verrucomicrobia bacterium LW23]|nr:hypothetical protein DB346_00760 [Verrucomicrobia bacterium LW23]